MGAPFSAVERDRSLRIRGNRLTVNDRRTRSPLAANYLSECFLQYGVNRCNGPLGLALPQVARSRSSSIEHALAQKIELCRPYIWRFSNFRRVTCPSVCPFDHGSVSAARIAA
jgi:hypothetical protein